MKVKNKGGYPLRISHTPTNISKDLEAPNKILRKYQRIARFVNGTIEIVRIRDEALCAEVWDVAGVERYLIELHKATYRRS